VLGNNIRVASKPRVVNIVGDTAFVEVNVSWDNSWRDDFNWDAAWVFLKYKKRGATEPWHHGYLAREGHNAGGGYSFMLGETGSGSSAKVSGVFLMRNAISEGNVWVTLRLKWLIKANSKKALTAADFGNKLDKIYVAIHAIEMVYIPYGSYYLGDNHSAYSFAKSGVSPCLIDSEAAITLNTVNPSSTSVSLASYYPKGYNGFYIMKYETSQEQYMEFLNSLTLEQQKTHVANNNFSAMNRGDYIFGITGSPDYRNGLVFIEQRQEGVPAVFGNNLDQANDLFSRYDGQTVACGYLSPYDMLAYCDWSGLRPMSELEYEKACRRPYPQIPEKGEYAWNSNSGLNPMTGESNLLYYGDERERSTIETHNVNSGGVINGPVRCGMFATASTNQTQAGATNWGVMEMSGNLGEMCYIASTAAKNFDYSVSDSHGDGELNADGSANTGVDYWPTAAGAFGVRGGSFFNADSLLRTSDRTKAQGTTFSSINTRYANFGFRGVRSIKIETNSGKIQGDTTCPGNELHIVNVQEASCPDFPDLRFQYNWYVKKPGESKFDIIPNESGVSLVYNNFVNTGTSFVTYQFKRVAVCAVGMAETVTNVCIAPKPWTNSLDTYTNVDPSFTVTSTWGNMPQVHWILETPPTGISISNKGLVSGLTTNPVFWTNVTVSSDKCPGQKWTKKIVVQREFRSVGSSSITLVPGEYVMECYGAEGGRGRTNWVLDEYGGNGAYTKGTILLSSSQLFYAYVGGKGYDSGTNGKYTGADGGWNGGGAGGNDKNKDTKPEPGAGGGGASDIRLEGGSWSGTTSLRSRIMVAAGGGGGAHTNSGYSGGTLSVTGGANQTSGYAFGYGQTGITSGAGGGGGGGGYYGGYSQQYDKGAGYGGSSFISGYNGCNAVNTSGSHTGQSIHYSGLKFYNATMTAGARAGDGLIRISPALP
uniref:glycine-rich protein n=1 Tax=Odoribacter lunatus TaxID=2941335 RepID=UPI00203E58D0